MAKTRKKLEQHSIAKLFSAPDAVTLDTLRKRIFHAGKQKSPIAVLDTLARLTDEVPSQFLPTLDANTLQAEDRLEKEYESEVRKIKAVYKDKRQILNRNTHLRLSLADTDEKSAQQNIRSEQLRLRYEKKRFSLLKTNAKIIRPLRKAHQAEVVGHLLEEEAQYLVYMRWNYEFSELSSQAAGNKIQRFDKKAKIYTLKSSRLILAETKVITVAHTAEIAKATTNVINPKSSAPVRRCRDRIPIPRMCLTGYMQSL